MIDIFAMFAWSFITVVIWMSGLWVLYYFNRNAGLVDVGWALGFILTMTVSVIVSPHITASALILALLVYIWGIRLAYHLLVRFLATPEDPRYSNIKQKWGIDPLGVKFLGMFILQGVLVVLLSLPFYLVCADQNLEWQSIQSLGFLVWGLGLAGESVADHQLRAFKRNPLHADKVCETGLWAYSRHPNYFFEWVIWIGYALIATTAAGGVFAWLSPLGMLYLLLRVSGIAVTETQLLKSKGNAYRDYQRKTSAFLPWPPKRI